MNLIANILPRRDVYDRYDDDQRVIPLGTPSEFKKIYRSLKTYVKNVNPNLIKEHKPDGESYGSIIDVIYDDDGIWVEIVPTKETFKNWVNGKLKFVSPYIVWDYLGDDGSRYDAALIEVSLTSTPRFAHGQKPIKEFESKLSFLDFEAFVPTKKISELIENEQTLEEKLIKLRRPVSMTTIMNFEKQLEENSELKKNVKEWKEAIALDKTKLIRETKLVRESFCPKESKLKLTMGEKMTEEQIRELIKDSVKEIVADLYEEIKTELKSEMDLKETEPEEIAEEAVEEIAEEIVDSEESEEIELAVDEVEANSENSELAEYKKENELLRAKLAEFEKLQKEAVVENDLIKMGVEPKDELVASMMSVHGTPAYGVLLRNFQSAPVVNSEVEKFDSRISRMSAPIMTEKKSRLEKFADDLMEKSAEEIEKLYNIKLN